MDFECREVEKHILIIQQRAVFRLEAGVYERELFGDCR